MRLLRASLVASFLVLAACGDDGGGGDGGAAGGDGDTSTSSATTTATPSSATSTSDAATSTSDTASSSDTSSSDTSSSDTSTTDTSASDTSASDTSASSTADSSSSSSSDSSSSSSGQGGAGGDGQGGAGTGGGDGGGGGAGGGPPLDGYGALSGSCGDIDAEDLVSSDPELLAGTLDLAGEPPITLDDPEGLTPGAQEMIADGNLGGSSLWSEVFAFEVLARCEGATLIKSEAEIVYAIEGKKTDILVEIDGMKVGVSVVRAVGFPPEDPYTVDDALPVLEGKLDDILQSSANVAPEDAWVKQILSVITYSDEHAQSIEDAWDLLDDDTRADTIVMVTVTDGDDDFIYFGD